MTKAEIADTAAAFIADNSKDALDALGADEETVERYLTLATIQNRMHTAIIADADTNVTDEEANTSSYSYVKVSKQSHTDEGWQYRGVHRHRAHTARQDGRYVWHGRQGGHAGGCGRAV